MGGPSQTMKQWDNEKEKTMEKSNSSNRAQIAQDDTLRSLCIETIRKNLTRPPTVRKQ